MAPISGAWGQGPNDWSCDESLIYPSIVTCNCNKLLSECNLPITGCNGNTACQTAVRCWWRITCMQRPYHLIIYTLQPAPLINSQASMIMSCSPLIVDGHSPFPSPPRQKTLNKWRTDSNKFQREHLRLRTIAINRSVFVLLPFT